MFHLTSPYGVHPSSRKKPHGGGGGGGGGGEPSSVKPFYKGLLIILMLSLSEACVH